MATLLLTQAGADLFINTEQSGTASVVLDRVAFGDGKYTASVDQTALVGNELRSITPTAGGSAADNVIHLTLTDSDTAYAYEATEIGVFSGATLVAVYSVGASGDPFVVKTAASSVWLTIDIALTAGDTSALVVQGDLSLDLNQATTSKRGTVYLATEQETAAGTDALKVVTPYTLKKETNKLVHADGNVPENVSGVKNFYSSPTVPTPGKNDSTQKAANTAWVRQLMQEMLLAAHPVGSYYITEGSENPAAIFGGTWQQVKDVFLMGAGAARQAGATGGASSVALTIENMPAHAHTATTASNGAHTHTATTASNGAHTHTATTASAGGHAHTATTESAGAHTHTSTIAKATLTGTAASAGAHTHSRGSMNITGTLVCDNEMVNSATGCFVDKGYVSGRGAGNDDVAKKLEFNAAEKWVGSTSSAGAHTHTVSVTLPKTSLASSSAGGHTHTLTTASAGAHTHTLTTASAGGHTHTLTTASAGGHTHTLTTASVGLGKAFSILPPYRAVNMWKRTA